MEIETVKRTNGGNSVNEKLRNSNRNYRDKLHQQETRDER